MIRSIMDASDLRIFEAVARLGSMSLAGAELNTVQSNVTARIRALEDEIGRPLFERHNRGVSLTAAGRRLLPYSASVSRLLEDARRAAIDDGVPKGMLTVGSLETTAALRLSPILTEYASRYPNVDLVLRTGTSCELVEQVLEHKLEGAFVCGPVDHPDLHEEAVFEEELVILTSPQITSLDSLLSRNDLKIIVLRTGCSYRQRLEAVLAARGIVGLRQLEFGTLESIYNCVSAGIGLTLLPKSLVGSVWKDQRIAVHKIDPQDAIVETTFIRRSEAYVSSALQAFLAAARLKWTPVAEAAE
jgi:DNA-binding transcriptional LysR family regulator